VDGSGRIAAGWWAWNSFTLNVNLLDGQAHVISFYLLDWNSIWRSEQIQLKDAVTGSVLDTQNVSSFYGGVYLRWQVSGNLVITVTHTGGANAVVSGLFFDAPSPLTNNAMSDLGMQSLVVGVPGSQGQSLATSTAGSSGPNSVTPSSQLAVGVAAVPAQNSSDARATVVVNRRSDARSSVSNLSGASLGATRVAAARSFARVAQQKRLFQ
jgi:hypothetical protein